MGRLLVVLLVGSTLLGCSWARQKINVENFHQKAAAVNPGQTKASELPQILGSPPNAVMPGKSGNVHLYNFGDSKTHGLNLFIVNFRKSNTGLDSALFFVDESGIVTDKVVSNNSESLEWEFWPFGGE